MPGRGYMKAEAVSVVPVPVPGPCPCPCPLPVSGTLDLVGLQGSADSSAGFRGGYYREPFCAIASGKMEQLLFSVSIWVRRQQQNLQWRAARTRSNRWHLAALGVSSHSFCF